MSTMHHATRAPVTLCLPAHASPRLVIDLASLGLWYIDAGPSTVEALRGTVAAYADVDGLRELDPAWGSRTAGSVWLVGERPCATSSGTVERVRLRLLGARLKRVDEVGLLAHPSTQRACEPRAGEARIG